jgi:hypothetical protein
VENPGLVMAGNQEKRVALYGSLENNRSMAYELRESKASRATVLMVAARFLVL